MDAIDKAFESRRIRKDDFTVGDYDLNDGDPDYWYIWLKPVGNPADDGSLLIDFVDSTHPDSVVSQEIVGLRTLDGNPIRMRLRFLNTGFAELEIGEAMGLVDEFAQWGAWPPGKDMDGESYD